MMLEVQCVDCRHTSLGLFASGSTLTRPIGRFALHGVLLEMLFNIFLGQIVRIGEINGNE